jgi:predicted nicotinamide N-methyase
LADYILANKDHFQDQYILEFGAGTGISGIIASSVAKKVFLTGKNQDSFCLSNYSSIRLQ